MVGEDLGLLYHICYLLHRHCLGRKSSVPDKIQLKPYVFSMILRKLKDIDIPGESEKMWGICWTVASH